jgi:hypothetical protein
MHSNPEAMGVFKWRRFVMANRKTLNDIREAADTTSDVHNALDGDVQKLTAVKRFLSYQAEVCFFGLHCIVDFMRFLECVYLQLHLFENLIFMSELRAF